MSTRVIYTVADIFVDYKPSDIERSSSKLLKYRLWFYGLTTVLFTAITIKLLSIDFDSFDDPQLKRMKEQRFTFLTIWMGIMHLVYFPLCFYLDWQEKNGCHLDKHTVRINKFRHFFFTAIIFPSTMYIDCFFWRVWNMDRELIVPSTLDVLIPFWLQHCLHTYTFIGCMVELISVPRFRPQDLFYHSTAIKGFIVIYAVIGLWMNHMTGFWPYPFFRTQTPWLMSLFGVTVMAESLFMFHVQWHIVDIIWGHRLSAAKS